MEKVNEEINFDEAEQVVPQESVQSQQPVQQEQVVQQQTQPIQNVVNTTEEEITPSSFDTVFLKHPLLNQETGIFVISKALKSRDVKRKDSAGNAFSIALSNADFVVKYETDKGQYTPSNWEVVNKITKAAKLYNNKSFEGLKINIKHVKDGKEDVSARGKCYEVYCHNTETPQLIE